MNGAPISCRAMIRRWAVGSRYSSLSGDSKRSGFARYPTLRKNAKDGAPDLWPICSDCGLVVAGVIGYGVVAFAGLDFLALLAGDVEGAEGAVGLEVGGGVAGQVLGA